METTKNWNKYEKTLDFLLFIFTTYLYGMIIGVVFHLLVAMRRISVEYYGEFPQWQQNLLVLSNHPALIEPFLLPALFWRSYRRHPFKYGPYSVPDQINFSWFFIKPRAILIKRGDKRQNIMALKRMKKILEEGGRIILFPEGGRTNGGRTVCGNNFARSPKEGKILRALQDGASFLARNTKDVTILQVWVEGTDKILPNKEATRIMLPGKGHNIFSFLLIFKYLPWGFFKEKITIKVGEAFQLNPGLSRDKVSELFVHNFLTLADSHKN